VANASISASMSAPAQISAAIGDTLHRMLELIEQFDGSATARQRLIDGVERRVAEVIASRQRGDLSLVARAETEVRADPGGRIRVDDRGAATVHAVGRGFRGGRFEVPPLCALKARALDARARAGRPALRPRLWVLDGVSPATDIGALQATAPPGTLFQVASQFNCLESPGAYIADVADYVHDPTQGPRASISAWPGTLVRHYAAPAADGSRFVQTGSGPQIDLLAEVCDPGVAAVRSGYLRGDDIGDARALAKALEARFDAIRIGVHDGVEVALGHDWAGGVDGARTIAQVFTSTLAAGMYGTLDDGDAAAMAICRQLQRAAYLGTLLAAAALGHARVVLTLIGGGVFANPIEVIWGAIGWAVDQVGHFLHRDLLVVVNGRNLGEQIPPRELAAAARARGGGVLRLVRSGPAQLDA
jgi:hypothetical protein